jgi:hypothetical protein
MSAEVGSALGRWRSALGRFGGGRGRLDRWRSAEVGVGAESVEVGGGRRWVGRQR